MRPKRGGASSPTRRTFNLLLAASLVGVVGCYEKPPPRMTAPTASRGLRIVVPKPETDGPGVQGALQRDPGFINAFHARLIEELDAAGFAATQPAKGVKADCVAKVVAYADATAGQTDGFQGRLELVAGKQKIVEVNGVPPMWSSYLEAAGFIARLLANELATSPEVAAFAEQSKAKKAKKTAKAEPEEDDEEEDDEDE